MLKNVIVDDKDGTMADAAVQASVKKVEERLGDSGRVLLRKSGTEPCSASWPRPRPTRSARPPWTR